MKKIRNVIARLHSESGAVAIKKICCYHKNTESTLCYNEGIRRMDWHMLMTTYKDLDGGVEYVRIEKQGSEDLKKIRNCGTKK